MVNSEEIQRVWNQICSIIRQNPTVNSSQVNAFFSRLHPQAMSDDFVMLTADTDFIKNWIERHYLDVIHQAFLELMNTDYTIAIEVDEHGGSETPQVSPSPSLQTKTIEDPAHHSPADSAETSSMETGGASGANIDQQKDSSFEKRASSEEHVEATREDNPSKLSSTSTLSFENFVIGESNRMAYSMAVSVAEEPGRSILNPLFIYGKSGLGKTHLMRAIQNYVAETRPELKTVYVDSADFLSGFVEAAGLHDRDKKSFKTFKDHYQEANILLIDDIQYLQGKEQTLDIVFQIFNKMVDEGKQVVLSADRAPKNITMDERYYSRFNSGGTFDIQPPEVETKLGIIKSFIEEYRQTCEHPDFTLSEEVQLYIAENSSSNIRELKSAITKIIYHINTHDTSEVSIEDVKMLLEDHFSGGPGKKLSIADIQKQVEIYYDVPHSELIGQKRSRKIVYARQIAIYLTRQMLDLPYNYIAKSFGGRDHTTIMYSVSNVEEKLKDNREIREEIENIKRKIREM